MKLGTKVCVGLTLLAAGMARVASASPVTFYGSSGNFSASVNFSTSGSNLVVTLTNTSSVDCLVPSDLLSGVFFDVAGANTLTTATGSAAMAFGAAHMGSNTAFNSPTNYPSWNGMDVGSEFAFKTGLSSVAAVQTNYHSANYGLSSSGLSPIFGTNDRFDTVHSLWPPSNPDGSDFGIASAGDDPTTGNGGITSLPIIQNQVVFTLPGWGGLDPTLAISNVTFAYGTAPGENTLEVVPLPGGALMAFVGFGGIAIRRRRAV